MASFLVNKYYFLDKELSIEHDKFWIDRSAELLKIASHLSIYKNNIANTMRFLFI